jgi:glycosyltransferase involved in cell wall biosynthesis
MAEKYPKISIVVQCFNRENYIAETIESIINQSYPNLECVVIDDNSSDGSWEIIQKYKDRLFYCEKLNGHNTSPVKAINYGLSKSTGEIMATINDKNLLMPKSLFTIAEVFDTFKEVEWVSGIGLITDPQGKITNVLPIRKDLHEHLIHVPWNVQHESTFWKRSLWDRAGAKYNETWAFDYELWCRFFLEAKMYHLNTIVGAYRKIPKSHGILKKDEYYSEAAKARATLRLKISTKEIIYAEIYKYLRYLKPILKNIPDKVFIKIPFLNHYSHYSISFSNVIDVKDRLKIYKRNPFRTIFPW